eukprot:1450449-Lingulodinium_polyedra.AAC.1
MMGVEVEHAEFGQLVIAEAHKVEPASALVGPERAQEGAEGVPTDLAAGVVLELVPLAQAAQHAGPSRGDLEPPVGHPA